MASYQFEIKQQNKLMILKHIYRYEPISRADLAKQLNLTKATVSNLVDELMREAYLYQIGLGESSGGRRPLMLKINEKAGYTISVDIGVNYIRSILTDMKGNIFVKQTEVINTNDYSLTLQHIDKVIQSFIDQMKESPFGLIGIGFGVPGLVDQEGVIQSTPNLDWQHPDLKDRYITKFGVPVIVENEANAGAFGAKSFGGGKEAEHFIYISGGIGIGVGLIFDGSLYRGRDGFTGELGHTVIRMDGLTCSCGKKGCWERYASELYILKEYETFQGESWRTLRLEDAVADAAKNPEVAAIFERAARHFAIGLTNIINSFNPEKIIIGNRLTQAEHLMLPVIKATVLDMAITPIAEKVDIRFNNTDQLATVLGLSAFSIEHFFDRQFSVPNIPIS